MQLVLPPAASVNLAVAVINLTNTLLVRRKKKRDSHSSKRKSQD